MSRPSRRQATAAAASRAASARPSSAQTAFEVREIPLNKIDLPKTPARRYLGDIAALAESMQDYGLQQPISVRTEGARFALTSGLRRLSAARLLRWKTIPAFVRTVTADDAYVLDLIENLQRQDLTPEEEADALAELIRTRGWTLHQVGDAVKRSVGYVSKRIRLFDDPVLRSAVLDRGLPVSTAEELLAAAPERKQHLIDRAIAERWDQVRAREALRTPELATDESDGGRRERTAESALLSPDRPRGFTRAVREFHQLVINVRSHDLTAADRAALRSLFRDLVLLARAPTKPAPRVMPELPTVRQSSRSRRPRQRA